MFQRASDLDEGVNAAFLWTGEGPGATSLLGPATLERPVPPGCWSHSMYRNASVTLTRCERR